MRRRRVITWTTSVAAALLLAPGALAATPEDIARDLADGNLGGTYTQQELADYLLSATVQVYENPETPPLPPTGETLPPPAGETPVGETPAAPAPLAPESGVAGVATPVTPTAGVATTPKQPKGSAAPAQKAIEQTARAGSLPFTGIDLALLSVGAVLLLLLGAGMRRLAHERS